MLRPSALLAAALVASPALLGGFITGAVTLDAALQRYLLAVPVCAVALALVRGLVAFFAPVEGEVVDEPRRRRDDPPAAAPS